MCLSGSNRTSSVDTFHLSINCSSIKHAVLFGVPQVFVLGPILFTLYTADIGRLISSFGLKHNWYEMIRRYIEVVNSQTVVTSSQRCWTVFNLLSIGCH